MLYDERFVNVLKENRLPDHIQSAVKQHTSALLGMSSGVRHNVIVKLWERNLLQRMDKQNITHVRCLQLEVYDHFVAIVGEKHGNGEESKARRPPVGLGNQRTDLFGLR